MKVEKGAWRVVSLGGTQSVDKVLISEVKSKRSRGQGILREVGVS